LSEKSVKNAVHTLVHTSFFRNARSDAWTPGRIAYEKAMREMAQARPAAEVVRLKTHSAQ
jgi:hypothetical protein